MNFFSLSFSLIFPLLPYKYTIDKTTFLLRLLTASKQQMMALFVLGHTIIRVPAKKDIFTVPSNLPACMLFFTLSL